MRVLGLIPARGGSKGIPRKNIRLLAGRPLLAYTAETALKARLLARVILSTDDAEIAAVGRRTGLEVPFLRPPELANDTALMLAVVQHAVSWLESQDQYFDAVCLLQPTNPLRAPEDIDGAVRRLEETGADAVISFVKVEENHPARMKYITPEGQVIDPPFAEEIEGQRRQDLPKLYLRDGSIYLTRRSVLMEQNSFKGKDCRAWIVPAERACNIDTPLDLYTAEQRLLRGVLAR